MIFAACCLSIAWAAQDPAPGHAPVPGEQTAQADAALPAQDASAHWRFTLEPFLWLAGIDGNGGDGSAPPVDIGQDVSLFGHIDGGFLLAVDARAPHDRYTLLADGLYLSLTDDEGSLQTDTTAWMFELGAGLPLGKAGAWEAIAGLRYIDLEFDSEVGGVTTTNARQEWIDPWVGARGGFALAENWALALRADVGGFGVGTQFTWQTVAAVRAELGRDVRFDFGYRAISLDFTDNDLEYDALIHGPFIALAFEL